MLSPSKQSFRDYTSLGLGHSSLSLSLYTKVSLVAPLLPDWVSNLSIPVSKHGSLHWTPSLRCTLARMLYTQLLFCREPGEAFQNKIILISQLACGSLGSLDQKRKTQSLHTFPD